VWYISINKNEYEERKKALAIGIHLTHLALGHIGLIAIAFLVILFVTILDLT